MSRKPQTCQDCARRKIKCDKIIPCNNCTKRGSAHLCRRADVVHSTERRTSHLSKSLSPGAPSFQSPFVPRRLDVELPINERILSLVTTLSERVQHLETKLDSLAPQKRSAPDNPIESFSGRNELPSTSLVRPLKQAKVSQPPILRVASSLREDGLVPPSLENELHSGRNSSDAEVEDAATVLEFLAWGRLKDSKLTSGLRDPSGAHDPPSYPDNDMAQTTQAWGCSPSSVSASYLTMETLQISQIQEMLPDKDKVMLLFKYHCDWLLFMHCSFHVQTFKRELEQFYSNDHGIISRTSSGLQWAALLFTVICGSMACAKTAQVIRWGFNQDDQSMFAKQWYQASIECLNTAKYQQNHSLYSVQTITSSTICAHILGFSNSQSVLLASAVRVAHSLGLHRLTKPKRDYEPDGETLAETIQKEIGQRIWQQLSTQDWFSVPFSETYCVNPLHFTTKPPLHCNEETMQPLPISNPTITSYGNFLHRIAALMPALQDRMSQATPNAKYEQVLHFDRLMRDLVTTQLPSCLNSQTPVDSSWPSFVTLARRCLTITSAHKIIMIHRRFLGISFHDKRFAFTRRTCLAAAKTIINEMKEDVSDECPHIWTTQAFSVAAAIILSLDNFNRHQSAREYAEHRQLVSQTIEHLSSSVSVSSIASRGTRLLAELLAEERSMHAQNGGGNQSTHKGKQKENDANIFSKPSERSLNVAAFVKKFCESDQPQPGNSPIATSHMPLWLQQDSTSHSFSGQQLMGVNYQIGGENDAYSAFHSNGAQPPYDMDKAAYQIPGTPRRQHETFAPTFGQNFGESFDARSLNWFDDLLGMAPSHSI